MFINFTAAFMNSDVLIICFGGKQLGILTLKVIRVISTVLEGQRKGQKEDKCNAYLSKGIWSAQKHKALGSSGLRKKHFYQFIFKGTCKKGGVAE